MSFLDEFIEQNQSHKYTNLQKYCNSVVFLLKLAGPTFFNSRKVKSNKYTGIHKQQYNHQDTGYLGHKLTGYGTSEQLPRGGGVLHSPERCLAIFLLH